VNPLLPVVTLLLSSALWGLTWLPLKHFGALGLEGTVVTLGAHGSVGMLALPYLARRWRSWVIEWPTLATMALLAGLANIAFASAMLLGDVLRVMVLFYLLPAWGVLGGRLLLAEPIDRARRTSLLLAVGGAFFVLGGPKILETPPGWIDLLAVAAGLSLALHNVLFRKLQHIDVTTKVGTGFVGCLFWSGTLVALGQAVIPATVPSEVWLQVMGFGLVWILLATVGTLWGVHHMEAGRSSILVIMELVTAVGSAALLAGRVPTWLEWFGGALIFGAAVVEARRKPVATSTRVRSPGAGGRGDPSCDPE
jgi:drug/metabolite transporter (DMT)-like permease